jgi:hypothetical protein
MLVSNTIKSNNILAIEIFITAYNHKIEFCDKVNLNLVSQSTHKVLVNIFEHLKSDTIKNLLKKYHVNGYYQSLSLVEVNVPGILYDALSSGCNLPLIKSSLVSFNDEVKQDVYQIVKLIPCSMRWNYGVSRIRTDISPLYIACLNENVPPELIEFLLNQGIDMYMHGNKDILICDLIESWQDKQRSNKIKSLFMKHIKNTETAIENNYKLIKFPS